MGLIIDIEILMGGVNDSGTITTKPTKINALANDDHSNSVTFMFNDEYYKLRHVTPRESLRVQGWIDSQIDKIESKFKPTLLYKVAGNGITVPMLESVFQEIIYN